MPNDDLAEVAIVIIIFCVMLFVGVSIFSSMADITGRDSQSGDLAQTSQQLSGSGAWHTLNDKTGYNETVYNSRGYAVNLTGASDSYIESDSNIAIATDQNWTVATWARVDQPSVSENMTVLSINGRLALTYNGTTSEWVAWYYNDGSGNSHEVAVAAPDQSGNFTHLTATLNGTHLTLYRNNTASNSVDVTASGTVDAPVNSSNFNGRLEETRTFDKVLNSSDRGELVKSPLEPQPGQNRTARVMYDEPYRSNQLVLFSGASLDQSNVTFSSGFEGSKVAEKNYTFDSTGPRIRVDSQTNLPVVYVDYTIKELGPGTVVPELSSALVLAAMLPTLLIIGVIIMNLQSVQRR